MKWPKFSANKILRNFSLPKIAAGTYQIAPIAIAIAATIHGHHSRSIASGPRTEEQVDQHRQRTSTIATGPLVRHA